MSEFGLRHALVVVPRRYTIGLRRYTSRLSFGIGHKLAATSHILVSFFDTPCTRGSCGRRPWRGFGNVSAESSGTRCWGLVLCVERHDVYILRPHPEYHGAQSQDIRDACCIASQLEDGPIACRTFLRSARRIHSLHSISDSTSPHRDAFCDFASSDDIFISSKNQTVSQWWVSYGWLAAPF